MLLSENTHVFDEKRNMLQEKWEFFSAFLKNYRQIASVIPTSQRAAKYICEQLVFTRPVVIVEYGPGIGNVSEEIVKRMSPTSRLFLIETNAHFVEYLQKKFAQDERVEVIAGKAQEGKEIVRKRKGGEVDAVIASIPFSFLEEKERDEITRDTAEMIKPGGRFLVFNFTSDMRKYLHASFGAVEESWVWMNVPPLRILAAQKKGDSEKQD
ncbi:methyltransferase domain-containing protein [bacterium]|nr:methyltransferase domain-containing protein [bacterium]NBX49042.1 methyltransferase domain-containing protein [bacterium]